MATTAVTCHGQLPLLRVPVMGGATSVPDLSCRPAAELKIDDLSGRVLPVAAPASWPAAKPMTGCGAPSANRLSHQVSGIYIIYIPY